MICTNDFFTTFDVKSGYHHIETNPQHRKFLRFQWTFEDGRIRFFHVDVLPFGHPPSISSQRFYVPLLNDGEVRASRPLFILTTVLQRFIPLNS